MGWLNERTAGGSEATAAVAQGSEWHAADDVRHSRGRSHPAAVRTWAEDVFSAGCLTVAHRQQGRGGGQQEQCEEVRNCG